MVQEPGCRGANDIVELSRKRKNSLRVDAFVRIT